MWKRRKPGPVVPAAQALVEPGIGPSWVLDRTVRSVYQGKYERTMALADVDGCSVSETVGVPPCGDFTVKLGQRVRVTVELLPWSPP